MSRIELVTPVLETKFHTTEPLRQWCNKGKLDDMFDSLSFLLGCKLFFYFSLFASCHSEVWRVSLQVFESKIDQKRCCFTLLLMKRTSTQQRRFMNTNYPTFSWADVIFRVMNFSIFFYVKFKFNFFQFFTILCRINKEVY